MKKFLKKLFGGISLTWPRLIIFSCLVGLLVGAFNVIPFLKGTSFQDFAVILDIWFVLAIFVIMNSKSRLDAVLKTFVFFLISQPLIYLVTSLFSANSFWFLLQQYYFRWYDGWFFWTLATIPGSAIAYEIKKSNIVSSIILSVATGALAFFGIDHILGSVLTSFPYHLLSGLIDLFFAFSFIFIILENKTPRILALILTSLSLIVGVIYYFHFASRPTPECFPSYEYDETTETLIYVGETCPSDEFEEPSVDESFSEEENPE